MNQVSTNTLDFTFFFYTGGNVSEMSASERETSQTLILDVNQEQTMLSKALGEQEEAERLLLEVQRFSKQQTANFKQNVTVTDVLQMQLEGLREEKRTLDSNTSHIRERLFHLHCTFLFYERHQWFVLFLSFNFC